MCKLFEMNNIYQCLLYFYFIFIKIAQLTLQLIQDIISIVRNNNYSIV